MIQKQERITYVLYYCIFHINGSADRTSRSDSICHSPGTAVCAVLHHSNSRKYASGAVYLSVCQKSTALGTDKPVIGKFFTYCIEKGEKGGKKLQATAGKGLFVALLLFVGIPLPGTGAWTGTLAASFLDMDFKSSIIAVMLGVMLAGIIMGLASAGLLGAVSALFAV